MTYSLPMAGIALLLAWLSPSTNSSPIGISQYFAVPDTVLINEWLVPWERTRPRDPYVAPDGRVWFCGQAGGYLAVLDPDTGEFNRFELGQGAGPHNLIVDIAGNVWYAGNLSAHIGRMNPESGRIQKYPMPEGVRDPHTLVFNSEGDIWFTAQQSNYVGILDTETGDVKVVQVPTGRARPYGIKVDSNDRPWIVLFGTNKLATVDPSTMQLTEFTLEREDARPRRLEITKDDTIWYVDYAQGFLGHFDPETGLVEEWPIPDSEYARPYGTALDDKERIWFVDGGIAPNQFVGFDTKTKSFLRGTAIPSGGGTVRHMYYHAPTREIWFGTDTNYIGKAVLPD